MPKKYLKSYQKLLMLLPLAYPKISRIFVPQIKGEVLEWLKRYAWKAYIPLKGIESSNLFLSAKKVA